jgi:hypothetical protein
MGIFLQAEHGIPLDPADRDFLTDRKKAFYVQAEKEYDGNTSFMRIDPLPNNLFLIKQRCYWFQFDPKGTKYPVTKEIAQSILRQDIREYLKNL